MNVQPLQPEQFAPLNLPGGATALSGGISFKQMLAQMREDSAASQNLQAPPSVPGSSLPTGLQLLDSVAPSRPPTVNDNPLAGLKPGDVDSGPGGPVARLQHILKRWNQRLDLQATGHFDAATSDALTLYKAIYPTDSNGTAVGSTTGNQLLQMENGTFWNHPPQKTTAGAILYQASRDLGVPYALGGNGRSSTDCAMLVKRAMINSGQADPSFSRLADTQYAYAQNGQHGLQLHPGAPQPGDLVFFHNPTSQSSVAYHGITHVGLYLGHGSMLAASSSHGKVVIQQMGGLAQQVAGYAHVVDQSAAILSSNQ